MKCIIFDMDGVIIDSEPIYFSSWKESAKQFGYTVDEEFYSSLAGQRIDDVKPIFTKKWGGQFPFEDVLNKRIEIWHNKTLQNIPLMEGMLDLLDFLDKKNIPRAVATSTHYTEASQILKTANIIDRFDVIVTGDQVKHGKPRPDIYTLTSSRLNSSPSDCFVVEDTEVGIQSAHSAGMLPILFNNSRPPSQETISKIYRTISSLNELKVVFEVELRSR